MIEWILCPECGKRLLKADVVGTLLPWCKKCKEEVEVKIEPKKIFDLSKCRKDNIETKSFISELTLEPVYNKRCKRANKIITGITENTYKVSLEELCINCQFNK